MNIGQVMFEIKNWKKQILALDRCMKKAAMLGDGAFLDEKACLYTEGAHQWNYKGKTPELLHKYWCRYL